MLEDSQREFDEFISDITPDVMVVLVRQSFFEQLEREVFPNGAIDSSACKHDFSITMRVLSQSGYDEDAIRDVIDVMRANGGYCDCEIILNAALQSKVSENYWKGEHAKLVDGKK